MSTSIINNQNDIFLIIYLSITYLYGIIIMSEIYPDIHTTKYKILCILFYIFSPILIIIITLCIPILSIWILYNIAHKYIYYKCMKIITRKRKNNNIKKLKNIVQVICIINYMYKHIYIKKTEKRKKKLRLINQLISIVNYIYKNYCIKRNDNICPVCLYDYNNLSSVILNCTHRICCNCLKKLKKDECPLCRNILVLLYNIKPINKINIMHDYIIDIFS
ncbi:unknown similar to ClanGV085 [Choristoneura biennis entomopoxvirus]|uniref:RING-type domain-containing protein n=1 Tax=Choristoneura biennis entomopoxvirus TaxID=10288 RepID=A0A916KPP7_CBEPV|nr:unknown similar to ClanGV085 [Choristoneura biennis entomopoxvirus]CCU55788.1 unknown similar to ClanGV085 [Choristoneura biennis entomopoxvirus]